MKFKQTCLASIIGALCSLPTVAATVESDAKVAFSEQQAQSYRLVVHLKESNNYQAVQNTVISQTLALSPGAKVLNRSRILSNFFTIEAREDISDKLRGLDNVLAVSKYKTNPITAVQQQAARLNSVQNTQNVASSVAPYAPFMNDAQAGEGASVAIISTGIDYTLKFFGGSGELGDDGDPETPPTPGSYLDALENGAIEFDGFPTDVVVGGWDFVGENYGNDANPIDQHFAYTSWTGWEYPTGLGTKIASIVHQLAPGADLYAYKITNVDESSARGSSFDNVVQSLEHALDPNQDGDMSDHVDVALLDGTGAAAFFNVDGIASMNLSQHIIEKASALGMTIVASAGEAAEYSFWGDAEAKHRYWISGEGGSISSIAVGSVKTDAENNLVVSDFSPKGPVRGSLLLKPELVSMGEQHPVAMITSPLVEGEERTTDTQFTEFTAGYAAAARVAAAAAVLKSKHSNLGPAEIKAILSNTATNPGILESDGETTAELISVGHGVENLDAATKTPVFAWDSESKQPYLQFGVHEVSGIERVVKSFTIRNISDSAQSYQMSHSSFDDSRMQGVTVEHASSVSVPAHGSTTVYVVIEIDSSKLPAWPVKSTEDFVDDVLKSTELNGYLTLSSENNPTLNLGWMVKARPATNIGKAAVTTEYPTYLGWDPETFQTMYDHLSWGKSLFADDEWGNAGYAAHMSEFTNESDTATTFHAYPSFFDKRDTPEGIYNHNGHFIRRAGGGIYDDARCEVTGKKFVMAVNLNEPANMTLSNHMDKIGHPIFFYDLFHERIVDANNLDEAFNGVFLWDEADIVNQITVSVNAAGQPATYYIDYSQAFDWTNPQGRITESVLPTLFNGDGTNIVSQFCLEETFHHEIDSVEDFDQNFGIHIETDRDVGRDKGEPIVQFNPIQGGFLKTEETCDEWGWCFEQTTDNRVFPGFAKLDPETPDNELTFTNTITLEPGETAKIAAVAAPPQFGVWSSSDLADPTLKQFMVMSVDDNFATTGYTGYLDEDGTVVADVRSGQAFTIPENMEAGVVGDIKLDTLGFFAVSGGEWAQYSVDIINTLEGTPFMVNDNLELVLVNPSAIDYESTQSYELKMVAREGNSIGIPAMVKVNITNVNDIAPMMVSHNRVNGEFDGSGMFSVDLSRLFGDSEGDAVSISGASGAGISSLSVSGMSLSGSVEGAGSYPVVVEVSDGVNTSSFTVNLYLDGELDSESEAQSQGGSFGLTLLALFGLFGLRKIRK